MDLQVVQECLLQQLEVDPAAGAVRQWRTDQADKGSLALLSKFSETRSILNVGFYNFVLTDKIIALVSNDSAPIRRTIQGLRGAGKVIDATQGRKTKTVIFTTSGDIVLSAISQETLAKRLAGQDHAPDDAEEAEE